MTSLLYNIGKILASMLFLWLGVFMLVTRISRKTRKMFTTFSQFFNRGAYDQQEIPAGDLPVQEFRELADSANRMIAERRLAEEALREKSEELEGYFTFSLDLLCIANTRGEFVRLNPEWEKILGYPAVELEGRSFLELVHPEDLQATRDAISALNNQQDVLNFENRYRCADGSYRWIEWRSRPKGDLIYATARDITDRKNTEKELCRSEARLKDIFDNMVNERLTSAHRAEDAPSASPGTAISNCVIFGFIMTSVSFKLCLLRRPKLSSLKQSIVSCLIRRNTHGLHLLCAFDATCQIVL